MKNWHEDETFWTSFSPLMFGERRWEMAPAEIEQALELTGWAPGSAVLDLGCGPGRHSIELAKRGYRVTGVDRTRAYLEEARRRAQDQGLEVEFVSRDSRAFSRDSAFEGAISLFTSFGYFEDQRENLQVLGNLLTSLKKGGSVLFDMMGKEVLARIYRPRDWVEREGVFFLEERTVGKDWSWMENRWIRLQEGERTEFTVSHWLYSAREFSSMLLEAGFSEVQVYGDLEGNPYGPEAKRLVALARK